MLPSLLLTHDLLWQQPPLPHCALNSGSALKGQLWSPGAIAQFPQCTASYRRLTLQPHTNPDAQMKPDSGEQSKISWERDVKNNNSDNKHTRKATLHILAACKDYDVPLWHVCVYSKLTGGNLLLKKTNPKHNEVKQQVWNLFFCIFYFKP